MAARREVVVYRGTTFVRYPDAPAMSARNYYVAEIDGFRIRDIGALHVEIWKDAHGVDRVPAGHVIHHIDFNPSNNDPSNLTCVTRKEHGQIHAAPHREARREWAEFIRPLAAAWHSSEEGIAWHKAHGRDTWDGRESVPTPCQQCGREFEAFFTRARFCSKICIEAAGRADHRYEKRVPCPVCETEFWQNKYRRKPETCCRRCAWVLRRDRARVSVP